MYNVLKCIRTIKIYVCPQPLQLFYDDRNVIRNKKCGYTGQLLGNRVSSVIKLYMVFRLRWLWVIFRGHKLRTYGERVKVHTVKKHMTLDVSSHNVGKCELIYNLFFFVFTVRSAVETCYVRQWRLPPHQECITTLPCESWKYWRCQTLLVF